MCSLPKTISPTCIPSLLCVPHHSLVLKSRQLSCGAAPIPGDGEPVTSAGRLRERMRRLGVQSPRRMQRLFWKQPKLEEGHAGSLQFRSGQLRLAGPWAYKNICNQSFEGKNYIPKLSPLFSNKLWALRGKTSHSNHGSRLRTPESRSSYPRPRRPWHSASEVLSKWEHFGGTGAAFYYFLFVEKYFVWNQSP